MRSLSPHAADHLSAALRHVRDAEHLLPPPESDDYASPDQAYHLAAFGPECARKAVIATDWLDKLLGHGHGTQLEPLLEFAAAIDHHAHHYARADSDITTSAFAAWNIDCRYKRSGTFDRTTTEPLVRAARRFVDDITLFLWADGRLAEKTTPW